MYVLLLCPSINIFGCRVDVIVDGIIKKRVFNLVLCMGDFSLWWCLFFLSPRLVPDN
jgi:hypothetical protein